jgi:hypothetical protein
MDDELETHTESRQLNSGMETLDHINGDDDDGGENVGGAEEDAHVLYNFIQSLEASAGDSGPVLNMLKEMESAT